MGFTYYQNDNEFVQKDVANDRSGKFYNLKKGVTVVRILPAYSPRGKWYEEIVEHIFNVNGKLGNFVCPASVTEGGFACPICAYGQELRKSQGAEDQELSKALGRRFHWLFNAVILADPENKAFPGVTVLKTPTQVKQIITKYDVHTEYGNVTDLEKGFNFEITREGSTKTDTKYTTMPSRHQTSIVAILASKSIDINKLELVQLDKAIQTKTEGELIDALRGAGVQRAFAGAGSSQSAPTPVAPPAVPTPVPASAPAPAAAPVAASQSTPDPLQGTVVERPGGLPTILPPAGTEFKVITQVNNPAGTVIPIEQLVTPTPTAPILPSSPPPLPRG